MPQAERGAAALHASRCVRAAHQLLFTSLALFDSEPAIAGPCQPKFIEYVMSFTETLEPTLPDKPSLSRKSEIEYGATNAPSAIISSWLAHATDVDPFWTRMAEKHPEVFSPARLQATRYGRWLYNSRVKRAADPNSWDKVLARVSCHLFCAVFFLNFVALSLLTAIRGR